MKNGSHLLQVQELKTYFYTFEGTARAVDDVSFYLNKVPGLYLRIGGAGKGTLHSGDLLLNEDLIKPAVKYLAEFISSLLRSQK
jgi:metal-dependent amidase/aminoacylase/carboxypeptidase family protein